MPDQAADGLPKQRPPTRPDPRAVGPEVDSGGRYLDWPAATPMTAVGELANQPLPLPAWRQSDDTMPKNSHCREIKTLTT